MIFTFLFLMQTLCLAAETVDVFSVTANWMALPDNPFTYFESTIIVPPLPSDEWKTLFLWPGLQPLPKSKNFSPIDNGVLQPVLTFGTSCAPNPNNLDEKGWWISSQYVNTFGKSEGHSGCFGGPRIAVKSGDSLRMVMELKGTEWIQSVQNQKSKKVANFTIDMMGQGQSWAEWVMETPGGWHSNPPEWNVQNIILKTEKSGSGICTFNSKVSPQPGAKLDCDEPVQNENTCKIANCRFNGA